MSGRQIGTKFVLVLASLVMSATMVEVALRAWGYVPSYADATLYRAVSDDRGYANTPSWWGLFAGVPVRTNSLGLRGPEIPAVKQPGEIRILVLGDSVAFGMGVPEEATFVARLEVLLRQRNPTRTVRVINSGVAGYNTVNELAELRALLPLQLDVVVLAYLADNDSDEGAGIQVDSRTGEIIHPAVNRSRVGRISYWLHRHSAAYNFTRVELNRLIVSLKTAPGQASENAFAPGNPGWVASQQAILNMRSLVRQGGAAFLVGGLGLVERIYGLDSLAAFCRAHDIPYVELWRTDDVAAYLRRYSVSIADGHPNPEGHRIIADRLTQALRPLLSSLRLRS